MALGDSNDCDTAADLRLPVLLRNFRQERDDLIDFTAAKNVRCHCFCRRYFNVQRKELASQSGLHCHNVGWCLCIEFLQIIVRSEFLTDREEAEAQKCCAISNGSLLGLMGAPIKLDIDGQAVFICCAGCKSAAMKDPEKTLATVAKLKAENSEVTK